MPSGGQLTITQVEDGRRRGLRLEFADGGPGIPDLTAALTDGWSSRGGLGLGLGGTRRLVDEFSIESTPGEGTRVDLYLPVAPGGGRYDGGLVGSKSGTS